MHGDPLHVRDICHTVPVHAFASTWFFSDLQEIRVTDIYTDTRIHRYINRLPYALGACASRHKQFLYSVIQCKDQGSYRFNTLPVGNNLCWIHPKCRIINSRVNTYRVFLLRLLYVAWACNLLISSVKTNASLPINQWHFH